MSIPVRSNLDLGLNQLLSALVERVGAVPANSSANDGRVIYDGATSRFYVGEGGTWRSFLITGTRLDQLAAPTFPVALNAQRITGLADGTATTDAASYGQLQSAVQGLSWKSSVRAASTANRALSGLTAIDGVTLVANDRVLLKNQTAGSENGIWVAQSGAWARAADADTARELESACCLVEEGTANQDTRWVQTVDNATLGTTALVWVQMDQGSAAYTAGNGLALTANDFSVNVDNASIEVNADTLRVKANGIDNSMVADGVVNLATADVTGTLAISKGGTGQTSAAAALAALGGVRKFSADITGNNVATSFTVNHALATTDVQVQVWEATTNAWVITDVVRVDSNNVRIDFAVAPATSKVYRVVVVG